MAGKEGRRRGAGGAAAVVEVRGEREGGAAAAPRMTIAVAHSSAVSASLKTRTTSSHDRRRWVRTALADAFASPVSAKVRHAAGMEELRVAKKTESEAMTDGKK